MNSALGPVQQNAIQNIKHTGSETEYSAKIVGQNVTVHCNSGQHNLSSSKVQLTNRIDYNWEFHYYRGQMVAVHINGKLTAIGMKGKDGGMVRVTNHDTSMRTLIKNLKNDVKDLSFAFSKQQVILGCIDDEGNVLVFEITEEPNAIKYRPLLHIFHRDVVPNSSPNFRIIWCPYISCFEEEEDSADDPEKMFVILNGNKAEIWNVSMVSSKYGVGPLEPNEHYEGYVEINHNAELVDASFSSDGTAIAIACLNGYVKFFQIYMIDNEKQKCLHEWRPHEGKPLSSIIFVDNLLECSSQCWKFTITGANHNSELKLWSCETWTCLQTIHFKPDPSSLIQNVYLKIAIDYSGQYLVMSDLNNKVLYILQLERNDEAQQIAVTTLSQFLLPTSFLSFHITSARCRKLGSLDIGEEYSNDDQDDDDDEDESDSQAVVVTLAVIQPKKFQECNVVFRPETLFIKTDVDFVDVKSDKFEEEIEIVPKLDDLQNSVTLLIQQQQQQQQQQQLTLMTPEQFTTQEPSSSPVRRSLNGEISKSAEQLCEDAVENLIDFQRPEKDNFASGGSSPSREVQEILSLNNSTYSTQDYFDNLTKMQEEQELPQKEYNHTEDLMYPENANPEIVWGKRSKDGEIAKDDGLRQDLCLGGGDEIANLSDTDWSKTHLQAINFRLTSLESAINDQNLAIQKVLQELKTVNQSTKENCVKEDFVKEVDLAMSKQQLQIAKMLENLINMQKNNEREQQDHLIANISQIVTKTVSDKLQNVVTHEMKHVVVPTIRNLVEALKHQLVVQNNQILNNDIALQEKISKMINSKALAESLSLSVANVVTPILEKCYRDMIASNLVPKWEKVCGNMFHQINDTFTQGTKEYTASVESYMERQRRVQEKGKDLIVQMQVVSDSLQASTDKLTGAVVTDLPKHLTSAIKLMEENIKEAVSEQIKLGFKNHASVLEDSVINAVRSRAVTPSPHVENQVSLAHLDHLIAKENYDEAIQLALSAENLNYVIYVCEKVDTNALFNGSCVPQQHCILALIQQLSMELHKNTDIKISYLRAAVVALVPGYPQTRQFIPKVLKDLLKQLQIFMASNPNSKYLTDVKITKMAVESILDK